MEYVVVWTKGRECKLKLNMEQIKSNYMKWVYINDALASWLGGYKYGKFLSKNV